MVAAGWTRGRGEARRLHGRTDSTVSSLHVARGEGEALDVKLHVAGRYSRYTIYVATWALWRNSKGHRVYTRASAHKPVTFALISYSYACANTSAIRAAPEIGRVFSSPSDILCALATSKGISNGVWKPCTDG